MPDSCTRQIDWSEYPQNVEAFTATQRRRLALTLVSYLLYPPLDKADKDLSDAEIKQADHARKQRQRLLAKDIANELVRIERSNPDQFILDQRWNEALARFASCGGFRVLNRASSRQYYEQEKLMAVWRALCSAYCCFDIILRASVRPLAAGKRPQVGDRKTYWIALLNADELPYEIGSHTEELSDAMCRYSPIAHILLPVLAATGIRTNPKPFREIRRTIEANLPQILADAASLQRLFSELHPSRSKIVAPITIQVRVPLFEGIPSPTEYIGLSPREERFLKQYTSLKYDGLTTSTVSRWRQDILAGRPLETTPLGVK